MNAAEIDVTLDLSKSERDKEEFLEALRGELATIGGANITVGQPLSHRIDHLLSGTRSAIAVKLFGDDLETPARRRCGSRPSRRPCPAP